VELFILWVLFGITCMVIASNKNRDGCGWLFLGFLLGPFAILMILASPALPTRKSFIETKDGPKTKKCPFCAEDILNAAIVCKHCGRDLPKPEPRTPPPQSQPSIQQTTTPQEDPDVQRIKKLVAANATADGGNDQQSS
jgi:hypothetical protein